MRHPQAVVFSKGVRLPTPQLSLSHARVARGGEIPLHSKMLGRGGCWVGVVGSGLGRETGLLGQGTGGGGGEDGVRGGEGEGGEGRGGAVMMACVCYSYQPLTALTLHPNNG